MKSSAKPSEGHAATATATEILAETGGTLVDNLWWKQQVSVPFAESAIISIDGRDSISNGQLGDAFLRLPMLTIYNFGEATDKNTVFVDP